MTDHIWEPVNRQITITEADPSTTEPNAHPSREIDPAPTPATRPSTPSVLIHPSDIHDSKRAALAAWRQPATCSVGIDGGPLSTRPRPGPRLWPLSMLASRCRPVGQTPIYEQPRGERINADVPPSPGDQHVHSGRHRLDEQTPGAAAVVGRPSGPEAGGVTGHHRWLGTSPGSSARS